MGENKISDMIFEALLKEAVAANFQAKMDAMPSEDEIARDNPFTEDHDNKMEKVFKTERRKNFAPRLFSIAKVAVITLCVLSTLTFAVLMTNPKVRATVWNTIVEFYNDHIRINYSSTNTESASESEAEKDARNFSWEYIPEGYEEISIEADEMSSLSIYSDADGNLLILNIIPASTSDVLYDNEHKKYYTEEHDGILYHILEGDNIKYYSSIGWTDGGFAFAVDGMFPIEELKKTVNSLVYNS